MPSLMELVERVNKGEIVDPEQLELYQESSNSAEKFLAHHAHAMLDLRHAQQHMMQSLEAIDYADQKVLNQFVSVSGFLGLTDLRCGPIVKFGSCAIGRREYALGIEAIQNAVAYDIAHGGAYTSDRENGSFIAQQYDRAAQCAGWSTSESTNWNNKQMRIAYVCSGVVDDDACTRTMVGLAKHHDAKRCKMHVYSTECGMRRDRQAFAQTTYAAASAKRGASAMEVMAKAKVPIWCCPTDGDVTAAAKAMAEQLVRDKIDVVVFDCTQADPIACMIAQWDCCRAKINLCRKTPMFMSGIHCVSYLDQNRFDADVDFWNRCGVDSKFILEGIDLDIDMGPAPSRGSYGIPENAIVMATCGSELDRACSDEFCETVINILRAHPHAIYLLIGEGDMAAQKRKFESAGVGKRVGYAGKRKDLPGFLRIADVYLAEFPTSSANGVLQAMSCERPVVAMRWGDASGESQAAAFVGSEACVGQRDVSSYIERVCKLIRDQHYRKQMGKQMRSRVEQHFGYTQTARHVEELCEHLLQNCAADCSMPAPSMSRPSGLAEFDMEQMNRPMSKVA